MTALELAAWWLARCVVYTALLWCLTPLVLDAAGVQGRRDRAAMSLLVWLVAMVFIQRAGL